MASQSSRDWAAAESTLRQNIPSMRSSTRGFPEDFFDVGPISAHEVEIPTHEFESSSLRGATLYHPPPPPSPP
eukprot:820786-Pyramimonas_sp.AAC.1